MDNRNINQELFDRQKDYLEYCLTQHETGEGKFLVLNHEAGFGKSRAADSVIINNPERKYLLVKKYIDEQYQSLNHMKESIDWIFGEMEDGTVVVVNADNSSKYENDQHHMQQLINANVVIISHEKYKLLSQGGRIDLYKTNRHTLIIDEYLDVPIVSINANYFNEYRVLFNKDLGRDEFGDLEDFFGKILKEAGDSKDKEGNLLLLNIPKMDRKASKAMLEKLEDLRLFFKSNSKEILKNLENSRYKDQPITHLTFYQFFSEIGSFLTNQCIYSSYRKSLSTYRYFDFWTLQNNIILDASGSILAEYTLDATKFKVEPQDSVFDYSATTIHIKDANSYKSYIETSFDENRTNSTKKYLEPIKKFIKKNLKNDEDEILIVNYKDHSSYFDEFKNEVYIHTSWHGNILGKNTWRTCNKLFINSTFNLPEQAYILIYSFYGGKPIRKTDLKIKTENKSRVFSNKKIEQLKQNYILHNLYQTIKRVNRDLDRKCDIYVVTNNAHFQKKIKNLLQNVNLAYDYEIKFPKTIQDERKEGNEKYVAIETELKRLSKADPRDYDQFSKKKFCEVTGVKSAKLKNVLKYTKMYKELCDKYGVNLNQTFKTGSRYIVFKNKK